MQHQRQQPQKSMRPHNVAAAAGGGAVRVFLRSLVYVLNVQPTREMFCSWQYHTYLLNETSWVEWCPACRRVGTLRRAGPAASEVPAANEVSYTIECRGTMTRFLQFEARKE